MELLTCLSQSSKWFLSALPKYVKLSKCISFRSYISIELSAGVFLISCFKNILAMCFVSPPSRTLGLIGAGYSIFSTFSQSTPSKNGWPIIPAVPPVSSDPNLLTGFFSSNWYNKFYRGPESQSLASKGSCTISFMTIIFDRWLKGGVPTAISNIRIPRPHQSTILLYFFRIITSGARY